MFAQQNSFKRAFTLIELSIVLVIIGLIVGGVLVGRDLIAAAAVRSQLTQMEKIQTAVNTFRGKFDNYLPGDIPGALVTKLGFTAAPTRAGSGGRGDGNGELDGYFGTIVYSGNQNGENFFFWEDLTTNSNLMEGNFTTYQDGVSAPCSSASCTQYIPAAKIGGGNLLYAYSGYASACCANTAGYGPNFIGITKINGISAQANVGAGVTPPDMSLTVLQSYNMDKKVDDGMPLTGNIMAQYLGGAMGQVIFATNAATASSSTCYDTTSNQYSITQNNGAGVNCAISFQLK